MQKKKSKKIFYIIILLVLLILIGYNIYKIVSILYSNYKSDKLLVEITDQVKKEIEVPPQTEDSGEAQEEKEILTYYDIPKLKSINSDTIGWIEVETTNINYPLVKTTNNAYYLNYSFDKSRNINGWVFMDYENKEDLTDNNTVIYAHNSVFKNLRDKYNRADATPFKINIYKEDYKYVYEVFSLYLTTPYDLKFLEKSLSAKTIASIKASSIVNYNILVGGEDKILTLATCYYDNTKRIITHAKLTAKVPLQF